jgi:hypothetical protein
MDDQGTEFTPREPEEGNDHKLRENEEDVEGHHHLKPDLKLSKDDSEDDVEGHHHLKPHHLKP